MKNNTVTKLATLLLGFTLNMNSQAETMSVMPVQTAVPVEKNLSSSILLWMRADKPRQDSMQRWQGAHAQIISANKGLKEYRQIHFAEHNTGLWHAIDGVETHIPAKRKIDGVADVTLKGYLSLLRGKKQNQLAHADEVNLFNRTILYASFPKNSKWYHVANRNDVVTARSMVFIRKRSNISEHEFQQFINHELAPSLANMGKLKELRTKAYSPWKQSQWNSPNVAHDNAPEVQFHGALILGFADRQAMSAFFQSDELKKLSGRIAVFSSAIHAYDVEKTLVFIDNGRQVNP
ncbi:hypothetical protein [Neisseria sp.]|uniref:hypothetical protein n=1 Tax=Neisseria sp. TaxID=192066 RepID=UPI0035A130A2